MKLAVIGSRNFSDSHWLTQSLNLLHDEYTITQLISGGAKGADIMGQRWADIRGIETLIFTPDWNLHGKRAGFIRNKDIVNSADLVIAFWDGTSSGTRYSIDLAHTYKKPIVVYIHRNIDKLLTKTTYN